MASIVARIRARIRASIVSASNFSGCHTAAFLVSSCIASSSGTRRQAGAAA
jgi:hypothetical protein